MIAEQIFYGTQSALGSALSTVGGALAAIGGLCFLTVYWQLRPVGMVPSLTPESTR